MRILYVNDRGNYYGGVEQSIADSSDGLRAAGHETVLAYGWDTGLGPNDRYFGHFDGHAECVGLGSNGSADVLDALVGEINPDVLYLNRIQSFAPFERYLGRIRVVRAIHDHDICCPTTLKYFRVSGKRCCHKAGWRCWLDTGFLERRAGSRFGFRYASIGGEASGKCAARIWRTPRLWTAISCVRNSFRMGFRGIACMSCIR